MYDPRNVLKQTPEVLRDLILTALAAAVALNAIEISEGATAILGLLIYKLLSVFYVAPAQRAREEEVAQGVVAIQNEIDRKVAEAPAVVVNNADQVDVASADPAAGTGRSHP